jgi:hypothetical protein
MQFSKSFGSFKYVMILMINSIGSAGCGNFFNAHRFLFETLIIDSFGSMFLDRNFIFFGFDSLVEII